MDESITRRIAIASAALMTMIYLASLLVYAGSESWLGGSLADALGFSLWIAAFTVVGVIIAFHRPGNRIAWICLGFAGVWSIWVLLEGLLIYEAAHPGFLARPDLVAALAYPLWVPGVGLIGFLLLLFPDGRVPSPRWRPVAWMLGGTVALLTLTSFFLPGVVQETVYENPLGIEALDSFDDGPAGIALVLILVGCIVASAVSVVLRYRRATGIERLQLKWLMAAGVVGAAAYALLFFWGDFNIQFVWAAIPVAIGLSMHRHRLYDIDRLISRTLVYGMVVGVLAIVYGGVIFLISSLSGVDGDIPVAASTLAAAAVFNPVRKRIQARVDQRFNRSRFDAERVADSFAGGLRDETDMNRIVEGWLGVVSETWQPTILGVWVR